MLEVFSPPEEFKVPEIDPAIGIDDYLKAQEEYVEKVKDWAKKHGKGKYRGEEIGFPQGDGQARYIIFKLKPCQLIWLPIGDRWSFPYIERLTAKDIQEKAEQSRLMTSIFSKQGKD